MPCEPLGYRLILTIAFRTDYPKKEELAVDERVIVEGIPLPSLAHELPWRKRLVRFRLYERITQEAQDWLNFQKARSFIADWFLSQENIYDNEE